MAKLLVLHGPNLNLLGTREPEVYGHTTLDQIDGELESLAREAGHDFTSLQSNAEHELVDRIQDARHDGTRFIVINPAAFTHTSVAIRDALAAVAIPSSKCTCPTRTRANRSATPVTSATSRSASSPASAPTVTATHSQPRWRGSDKPPPRRGPIPFHSK
jgi:3-dehydroquinate dehydratase